MVVDVLRLMVRFDSGVVACAIYALSHGSDGTRLNNWSRVIGCIITPLLAPELAIFSAW
jgi:hypothetical protein